MSGAGVLAGFGRSEDHEQRQHQNEEIVDLHQRGQSKGDQGEADGDLRRSPRDPEPHIFSLRRCVQLNEGFRLSRQAGAGASLGLHAAHASTGQRAAWLRNGAPVDDWRRAGWRRERLAHVRAAKLVLPRVALVAWAVLAAVAPPAVAKDLGVRGETWPIAEPDLLEQIATRLAALELSGATARFEREAVARARAHVEAPPRVAGVVPATEPRSWLFDPSIVVERDVATPDGTVVAAAGTRVNPLLARPLSRDVLFVDGARTVEVAWALAHPRPARIVLVGGRPLALSRAHGRSFFFDQGGALTARLGIAATPARAFQEGAALRIEETPLEDRAPFEAVGRASGPAPVETGR